MNLDTTWLAQHCAIEPFSHRGDLYANFLLPFLNKTQIIGGVWNVDRIFITGPAEPGCHAGSNTPHPPNLDFGQIKVVIR